MNTQQAKRLYEAVERLALQAGEDTDETIDWLCGEHGGMAKLFEKFFSPAKTMPQPAAWVGLTDEEANELWESTDSQDDWELLKRVEAKLREKNGGQAMPAIVDQHPLSAYINAAGISANDSPHVVVSKLERSMLASATSVQHLPSDDTEGGAA